MSSQKRGSLFGWLSGLAGDKQKKGGGARQAGLALPYRLRSDLLSQPELSFYHALHLAVRDRFVINCKVGLNEIFYVARQTGSQAWMSKIDRKHVGFLLCDPTSMKPIAGIELEDSAAAGDEKRERDAFVDRVFSAARLPLLRMPVRQSYKVEEIRSEVYGVLGQAIPVSRTLIPTEAERILLSATTVPVPEVPLRRAGTTGEPSTEVPVLSPIREAAAAVAPPEVREESLAVAPTETPLRRRVAAAPLVQKEPTTATLPVVQEAMSAPPTETPLRRRGAAPRPIHEEPATRALPVGQETPLEAQTETPNETLLWRQRSQRGAVPPARQEPTVSPPTGTPSLRRRPGSMLEPALPPPSPQEAEVVTPPEATLMRRVAEPPLSASAQQEATESAPPRRRLATQDLFERGRQTGSQASSPFREPIAPGVRGEAGPLRRSAAPSPSQEQRVLQQSPAAAERAAPRVPAPPISGARAQSDQPLATPPCPKCGRPMSLMTVRRGPNKGSQVWGCLNFPSCQETMPAGES